MTVHHRRLLVGLAAEAGPSDSSARLAGREKGALAISTLSLEVSPSTMACQSRLRSWLARFIAALQESRRRSARAEIARHRHLLPAEFERAGNRLDERSEHQLPIIGRG